MNKNYSYKEWILRFLWVFIEPLFFSWSPRLFYGWRNVILRMMGAKIGKHVQIFPSARITFPWLLEVGDNTVISWSVRVYNLGKIKIGHNTLISQHSHLCGGTHDYKSKDFILIRNGLTVGNNVWIAADAFIGPGVIVNDGALVGACAVVMNDVPEKKMVAGNPAIVIKDMKTSARL